VVGHHRFEGSCCLDVLGEVNGGGASGMDIGLDTRGCDIDGLYLHPEDGGGKVLRNIGILPQSYTPDLDLTVQNKSCRIFCLQSNIYI
jgi:hypothetical protein